MQRYLRKLRSHGGKVNRGIAIAVATGILKKKTPLLLQVNASTPKQVLTNDWARSLLRRMKFVKRKGTKAAKKVPENFVELGDQFKARIHSVKTRYQIPPEMIVTFDETASKIIPTDDWTLEEQGATQVSIIGADDKRAITLGLAFSGSLEMLQSQLIYEGKTDLCHPNIETPAHVEITHSESHWSTENTIIQLIERVFAPYMVQKRLLLDLVDDHWGLLIWDVYKPHLTQPVLDLLVARRIKVVFVPANCTSMYSANDHPQWNKNVKLLNNGKFTHWYADIVKEAIDNDQPVNVNFQLTVMKPIHARWTFDSLLEAATKKNWMEAAWKGVGLWDIIQGNYIPPQPTEPYVQPTVVSTEAANKGNPPSDYESDCDGSENGENVEVHCEGALDTVAGNSDEEEGNDILCRQPAMSKRKIVHEDSPVKSDGVDDSNGKLHACTTWQSQTPPPPARKRTTVNSTFAMSEDDQVRMAIEASLETNVGESKEESTATVVWSPGTGVGEEQTRVAQEMVLKTQWRVQLVNERWQLAKLCLL